MTLLHSLLHSLMHSLTLLSQFVHSWSRFSCIVCGARCCVPHRRDQRFLDNILSFRACATVECVHDDTCTATVNCGEAAGQRQRRVDKGEASQESWHYFNDICVCFGCYLFFWCSLSCGVVYHMDSFLSHVAFAHGIVSEYLWYSIVVWDDTVVGVYTLVNSVNLWSVSTTLYDSSEVSLWLYIICKALPLIVYWV